MDRSQRAKHARSSAWLWIALAALAGCQGRTPAPAPALAEEHLQRRLPATEPATLPQQATAEVAAVAVDDKDYSLVFGQPLKADPQADAATSECPADFVPLEAISRPVEVAAIAKATPDADAPKSDELEKDFSINDDDAFRRKESSGPQQEETSVVRLQVVFAPQPKPATVEAPKNDLAAPMPKETSAHVDLPAAAAATSSAPPAKPAETRTEPTLAKDDHADAGSPLPWGPSTPTSEMIAIAKRAEETARRGFDLAERGALYTARAQFIETLRSIAQAIDSQRNTMAHTRALAAGLHAMEEVDDFVPRGTGLETDLNLKLIIDAHRTPVLKEGSLDNISAIEAQRRYLTYAQEQLAAAAGDQPVASLALYGLGKVCAAPVAMHGPREKIAECKAVVFYQAALVVEPRNFLSANELGVLLARFGRLEDARTVLERAVAISNAPTSWRNLAVVYQRLGNAGRAEEARQQADVAVAKFQHDGYANAGMRYPINWLDPASFAQTNSMLGDTQSVAAPPQKPTAAVPETAAIPEKKSSNWWGLK